MGILGRWRIVLAVLAVAIIGVAVAVGIRPGNIDSSEVSVAAAADLNSAFTEIATLYEQETRHKVVLAFGSTGQLAQQVENGAPFDILAAANVSYIDDLRQKGLVIPETQQLYAQGRIVLAVNKKSGVNAIDLEGLLNPAIQHIAIANPDHAPYGVAAMQALQTEGIWEQIKPRLVYGENIQQTLQYIQTGNAEVGIVALSVANVPEISWTPIDGKLHQPLNQALAVIKDSQHEAAARNFVTFVNGPQGRAIMKKYGFLLPGEFSDR
ncbi:MAG: molybdate ABC transporter substrate-binding protein [Chloroflexi bacterium]|nr:molybdate ABC transporter substrate-binding protein [Chloroflexota bacterium]